VDADANSNGTADCLEQTPVVTLAPSGTALVAGDTLTVRASVSAIGLYATGVQLALNFDPNDLAFVSAAPVAGGAFQSEVLETLDSTNGTLKYTLGLASGASPTTGPTNLADFAFVVLPGADLCNQTGAVFSAAISTYVSRIATEIGHPVSPSVPGLSAVTLDGTDPVFTGVPSATTLATDAGSLIGGTVTNPGVTASDNCSGSVATTFAITYPDTTTATTWPVGGVFPIGTSSVTWSAADALGNIGTATRTITVANHQLLDLSLSIFGGMSGGSTQSIRVKAGANTQVVSVAFAVSVGVGSASTTVQVPVAASYSCISAKDTVHSITKTAVPTILSERYSASVTGMRQGDSNDDDMVDITDFAIFVANRGAGKAVNAVSNFNGDTFINTADFTFLTLSFFQVGDTCGAFTGATPRDRVSVRELRRTGQGELIAADLNGDGWVDLADMQMYMQGAAQ
jgi:hypothetical protein